MKELAQVSHGAGSLVIVDEIWTGLGRSGRWLYSDHGGFFGDLICLGKGLGGGVPISACVGSAELMQCWSQKDEVVHTATYAGAPLGCAAALQALAVIEQECLVERSRVVGESFRRHLEAALIGRPGVTAVRGAGLMVAVELGDRPGAAAKLQRSLLARGYVVSTGGGQREVLVMTPPLTVDSGLLEGFVAHLESCLHALAS
jgi:4-aminobutyrate aminotransferase/(S)-3-amino-2-methylpropionate transaminase